MKHRSFRHERDGRRVFLRGACSTLVALPLFECLLDENGTAFADGGALPTRFVLFYCPTSLVASGSDPVERFTPSTSGETFDLPYCLEPLAEHGVAGAVSAVSGLFVPPFDAPGAYQTDYHGKSSWSVLTGLRHGFLDEGLRIWGPSPDQVAASAFAGTTQFPSLVLQVDPVRAGHGVSFEERAEGKFAYAEAQTSPSQAYRNLFTDFRTGDPTPGDTLEQRLRESSLSYVRDQLGALRARLGSNDRQRLERHLDQVRALETRVLALGMPLNAACTIQGGAERDPADVAPSVPDQAARSALLVELIRLSFACNQTRVVSLSMSDRLTGSGMAHPLWQHVGGLHADLQHAGTNAELDEANRWFVGEYAALLLGLERVEEGGGTILDNTAAVFCMEGGKGGRGADGGGDQNHSTDNMVMLVGGRAGGLRGGQHLVARDLHTAAVMNTALKAVGVSATLGEISASIESLL